MLEYTLNGGLRDRVFDELLFSFLISGREIHFSKISTKIEYC